MPPCPVASLASVGRAPPRSAAMDPATIRSRSRNTSAHPSTPAFFKRQEGVRRPRSLEAVEVDRGILRDADGRAFRENLVLGLEARPLRPSASSCGTIRARPRRGYDPCAGRNPCHRGEELSADPLIDVAGHRARQCPIWSSGPPAWSWRRSESCLASGTMSKGSGAFGAGTACRNRQNPWATHASKPAVQHLDLGIAEHGQEIIAAARTGRSRNSSTARKMTAVSLPESPALPNASAKLGLQFVNAFRRRLSQDK